MTVFDHELETLERCITRAKFNQRLIRILTLGLLNDDSKVAELQALRDRCLADRFSYQSFIEEARRLDQSMSEVVP